MYRFSETPQYIRVIGLTLALFTAGIVFRLSGISVIIGTLVLALPFIVALEALRRRIGKK